MQTMRRGNAEVRQDTNALPHHVTLTDDDLVYNIKPGEHCVFVDTTTVTGDGNAIVNLPAAAECAGELYFVNATTGATGGDVSLKADGTEISTYGDMDADNDHAVFFSTGKAWLLIFDGVA